MAQLFFAHGVKRVSMDSQANTSMPIFLDDCRRVIEAPSQWIINVAKNGSR